MARAAAAAASMPWDEDRPEAMASAPTQPLGPCDNPYPPPGSDELGRPVRGLHNVMSPSGYTDVNRVATGSNSMGYPVPFGIQKFDIQSLARASSEPLPASVEPQVQWWVDKVDERDQSTTSYKLRSVGNMLPTNLSPTQPHGRRNKAKLQRVKFQDHLLCPQVPQPFRPPCDMGLAMALSKLENSGVQGVADARQDLRESFMAAYTGVVKAAKAYEDLCQRTQKLMNSGLKDVVETVKRAKICGRDVLLWRWFGLTGWIYNQAESEFFKSYGREIESQLMNSVAKIRQRVMQDLMRRPCWKKLEAMLKYYSASGSTPPQYQGLLDRCRFIHESLGGPRNPELQEFRVPEDPEQLRKEMALQEEKERQAEAHFANHVQDSVGRLVSESVVNFLALDEENLFPPWDEENLFPPWDEENDCTPLDEVNYFTPLDEENDFPPSDEEDDDDDEDVFQ